MTAPYTGLGMHYQLALAEVPKHMRNAANRARTHDHSAMYPVNTAGVLEAIATHYDKVLAECDRLEQEDAKVRSIEAKRTSDSEPSQPRRITEYDLVNACDLAKHISEGWQPFGSPIIDSNDCVITAIVKYE